MSDLYFRNLEKTFSYLENVKSAAREIMTSTRTIEQVSRRGMDSVYEMMCCELLITKDELACLIRDPELYACWGYLKTIPVIGDELKIKEESL